MILPEEWSVKEEFEHQGRGDLIWDICHTNIKERKLGLDDVSNHDVELGLPVGALDPLL